MTRKIFQSMIAVVVSVLLLSLALITGVLYEHFESAMLDQMRTTASFVEQGVKEDGMKYLDEMSSSQCRITWIEADGTVKFDNRSDPSTMENHADRAEVKEALENESGTSIRRSSTLSEHTLYYAKRMQDGTVLRLAMSQRSVLFLMGGMISPVVFIFLAACALAGVLSYRVSKKIVKPLGSIDLQHPEQVETYDELSPFLQRIAAQNREIRSQMEEIRKQQQEFSMITENMSEGLFVVDRNYQILSYNRSAVRIFGMAPESVPENLLAVNRSEGFRSVVDSALKGRHAQENLELDGRVYQIIASPVCQQEDALDLVGAVILTLDVTEKEAQEQYRREFTANVSHELKTPLTSISGIAEIIRNGIVRPEDIPHFAGKIYDESQRLITLIGDIIKLSRLDENQVPMERESVDLLETARDVVQQLASVARKKRGHAGDQRQPRRGERRAPGAGGDGVQSLRKCGEVQPPRRQGLGGCPPGGRPCGTVRQGYRHRHPGGRAGTHLRAVLPGGQEPLQGGGRHRSGAVHRQARRSAPPCGHPRGQRTRRGDCHHTDVPGRVRKTVRKMKKAP